MLRDFEDHRAKNPPDHLKQRRREAGRPIGHVPPGDYLIPLDFYSPPNYQPGDEAQYLNIRDHPLRIGIEGQEHVNPVDIPARSVEDF